MAEAKNKGGKWLVGRYPATIRHRPVMLFIPDDECYLVVQQYKYAKRAFLYPADRQSEGDMLSVK